MDSRQKQYLCELCMVQIITANSEEEAISIMAEHVTNINSSELEDFIEARQDKDAL